MPRRIALGFMALWLTVDVTAAPDSATLHEVERLAGLTMNTEYATVYGQVDSIMQTPLRDPIFLMLKLMAIGLQEMDFETVLDSTAFPHACAQATALLDSMDAADGVQPYSRTIRGFVMASQAAYDVRRKHYVRAVRVGLDALEMLEDVAAEDSSLADPDYFLGLYDWSKSDLRRRMWWVLFWLPGNPERGVMRLERCRRESYFSQVAAALSLVDIYSQSERLDKARAILDELDSRFGSSRFVLWSTARCHEHAGELLQAAETYGELAQSYRVQEYGRFNAAFCAMEQARVLFEADRTAQARAVCTDLVAHHRDDREGRIVKIREEAERALERTETDG